MTAHRKFTAALLATEERRRITAPTEEQLERASATLAAVARIDSLRGGFLVFEAEGLAGGRWYEADEWEDGPHESVKVPVPDATDGAGLEDACRRAIEAGIAERQRGLEGAAAEQLEEGSDAGLLDAVDFARLMFA